TAKTYAIAFAALAIGTSVRAAISSHRCACLIPYILGLRQFRARSDGVHKSRFLVATTDGLLSISNSLYRCFRLERAKVFFAHFPPQTGVTDQWKGRSHQKLGAASSGRTGRNDQGRV